MFDSATTLHLVVVYGYPLLAAALFIASVGLPLPVGVALMALGALSARNGLLSLPLLLLLGTLARLRRVRRGLLVPLLDHTDAQLQHHGATMVFLSRFAFTALATPVSLLVGASRLRLRVFLLWDALGEALFVLGNLALGRLFGAALLGNDTLEDALWLVFTLLAVAPLLIRLAPRVPVWLRARRRSRGNLAPLIKMPRLLPQHSADAAPGTHAA